MLTTSLITIPSVNEKTLSILSDPEEALPPHAPLTVRAGSNGNPTVVHPHVELSPSDSPGELAGVLGCPPHAGSEAPPEVVPKRDVLLSQRMSMAAPLEAAHLDVLSRDVVVDVHVCRASEGRLLHHQKRHGKEYHGKLRHDHLLVQLQRISKAGMAGVSFSQQKGEIALTSKPKRESMAGGQCFREY